MRGFCVILVYGGVNEPNTVTQSSICHRADLSIHPLYLLVSGHLRRRYHLREGWNPRGVFGGTRMRTPDVRGHQRTQA